MFAQSIRVSCARLPKLLSHRGWPDKSMLSCQPWSFAASRLQRPVQVVRAGGGRPGVGLRAVRAGGVGGGRARGDGRTDGERCELGPLPAECCLCLLDVHPVQAEQVLPEDLPFGLIGQLWVAIALAEIFWDLEVHEGAQRPLRVE